MVDAAMAVIERLQREVDARMDHSSDVASPVVTLTYAQSVDGSIATDSTVRTCISGSASMQVTHRLRATHDAILVGVDTVIADDPKLTVRLCEGGNPQPIVLDSNLRIPRSCALLQSSSCRRPLILAAEDANDDSEKGLIALGARVIRCKRGKDGGLDLPSVLGHLRLYRRIMVEGGGRVITSFLTHGCVDLVIVTIAPIFIGGYHAVQASLVSTPLHDHATTCPRLEAPQVVVLDQDLLLMGTMLRRKDSGHSG